MTNPTLNDLPRLQRELQEFMHSDKNDVASKANALRSLADIMGVLEDLEGLSDQQIVDGYLFD